MKKTKKSLDYVTTLMVMDITTKVNLSCHQYNMIQHIFHSLIGTFTHFLFLSTVEVTVRGKVSRTTTYFTHYYVA